MCVLRGVLVRAWVLTGWWLALGDSRWTSDSEGRLSRNLFIVRLGRWFGVEDRDERVPQLICPMATVSMLWEPGRVGEEKAELKDESSDSDRLRLMTILTGNCR